MKTRLLLEVSLLTLGSSPALAQNCANTSVGFTPLDELGTGTYLAAQGGLWPGGANLRPAQHSADGIAQGAEVVPRDAAGSPDPAGLIGFISIGMSNTRNHFQQFEPIAAADVDKSPLVVVKNCAQGGQPAEDIDDPAAPYWAFVDASVSAAGLTGPQVQAAWLLQANRSPTAPFPQHAETLRDQLRTIVRILRDRFPNLRQVFFSSRVYAGYATTALNPEPWAYESGFAVKWLLEQQLAGDPDLEFDPTVGPIEAPWLTWGPYVWGDGLTPRLADGLVWECSDFNSDGTHPAPAGGVKLATRLLAHLKSDPASNWWFASGVPRPTGVPFCFGDGGVSAGCTPCRCGNDAPAGSGTGCLNGAGTGARLSATGTASSASDSLAFGFEGANPLTFAVLVSGGTRLPAGGPCPEGSGIAPLAFDGLRCIGGGAVRHGARSTGALGENPTAWGPTGPPGGLIAQGGYQAGQTRHFQLFYRELPTQVCGSGQNTSQGVSVAVLP